MCGAGDGVLVCGAGDGVLVMVCWCVLLMCGISTNPRLGSEAWYNRAYICYCDIGDY